MSQCVIAMLAWCVVCLACTRVILRAIHHEAKKTMSALTDLQTEVANTKSVELSAIKLINGLAQRLEDALNSEDTDQAVEDIVNELKAGSTDLAAAVAQNTPADPTGGTGAKSFDGSTATAQTASPAPEDLPDGHPSKPADTDIGKTQV